MAAAWSNFLLLLRSKHSGDIPQDQNTAALLNPHRKALRNVRE
jgi:hypothetical protein